MFRFSSDLMNWRLRCRWITGQTCSARSDREPGCRH